MRSLWLLTLLACLPLIAATPPRVIVAVGAEGEETFGREFAGWSENWIKAAAKAGAQISVVGTRRDGTNDLAELDALLDAEPKAGDAELWLVLLGHGTFAAREAKFNLRGPDLSATNLAERLHPFTRPLALINAFSASGPFLAPLAGTNRVVLTATRSGAQANYSRFGGHLAEAIGSEAGDLDKDGQVSLLEAFILAAARTAEFYRTEGRLQTEHALLDDSGDGLGVQGDWFQGVRAVKRSRDGAPVDGALANRFVLVRSATEQAWPDAFLSRRAQLEGEIERLRSEKTKLREEDYHARLEPIVHALAASYAQAEGRVDVVPPAADGGVVLHASRAAMHGNRLRYEPQPHKDTLGYWTNPTDWAEWTFVASRAGDYELTILQACGRGSGGSEVRFAVGDSQVVHTVEDTGAFTNFVSRSPGRLTLTAGTNTLSVRAVTKPGAAVMDLREVRLTPVAPPAN